MSKTIIFCVLILCLAMVNAYGGGRRSAPAPVFHPAPPAPAPVVSRGGWGGAAPAPVFQPAPVVSRGGRWGGAAPVRAAPVFSAPVRRGGWGGAAPVRARPQSPCEIESIQSCGGALTTSAAACRAVCKANCEAKNGHHKSHKGFHIGPIHFGGKHHGGKHQGHHATASSGGRSSSSGSLPFGSGSAATTASAAPAGNLGFLGQLPGKWVGEGMNMVQLPNFDSASPSNYRVLVSRTKEEFDFTPIGGSIANRGCAAGINDMSRGQRDINYFGLTYMQSVTDFYTGEGLHVEPGLFLSVPATDANPVHNASVVRMASIPHGDTIHCESNTLLVTDLPSFDTLDTTPTGPITSFLVPVTQSQCPPTITPEIVKNPNLYLANQIVGQNIVSTTVIEVNSKIEGSTSNIPYVRANAEPTEVESIFWIETVRNADGSTFLQMQYTQTVFLRFLDSVFPHTSVATLRKL